MAGKPKRCVGHGIRAGTCTNVITADALKLNKTGLWCVECEEARRVYLSAQFGDILESFKKGNTFDVHT